MKKEQVIQQVINPKLDEGLKKADKSKYLEDEINYHIANIRQGRVKFIGEVNEK